jgi:3-phytase/alkaline phosphatase D
VKNVVPLLAISLCTFHSAADADVMVEYLGEATFPSGYTYAGTEVGGLSGIDYDGLADRYVAISDDRVAPRFYELTIDLSDGTLDEGDVAFAGVTDILDSTGLPFAPLVADPEAIRLGNCPDLLYWTSEGDATAGLAPFVRVMRRTGQPVDEFELPARFLPTATSGIRNNLAFESLTFANDAGRLVTATENALIQDGPAATLTDRSPVRVLTMSPRRGTAGREFIYRTDPTPSPPVPSDAFATNGLVELLWLGNEAYLALERAFATGVGNDIRLYLTSTRDATDVQDLDSIQGQPISPMRKRLLFDLATLGIPLDNIEGMTYGPTLPDGSRTLILVSDNNFSAEQFTQFLAFRIVRPDEG